MLIRKNTKAFKTIVEIITICRSRPDRENLVRLYITKAGHTVSERISIEGIQGDSAVFYELNYQTVFNNLKSSNHQLHASDDIPGLYFFHSSSNKAWDETPFEFDDAVRKEFSSLPELPVTRKKEKLEKFVLPVHTAKPKSQPTPSKAKATPRKATAPPRKGPRQPDFKLAKPVFFTALDRIIFRQAKLDKERVLEYYNDISEYILPHLKDRPLWTRLQSDLVTPQIEMTVETLFRDKPEQVPDWIQTTAHPDDKQKHLLLCNDRGHLMFYVENGCLEFDPSFARVKKFDSPDYIVITMDSPDSGISKVTDVALTAQEILTALQLPAFVKSDGIAGLHIIIPLDGKATFGVSRSAAEYLCKLVNLKIPDSVAVSGLVGNTYGKVMLDYHLNSFGKSVVAPYSLVPGQSPIIATPLRWEELNDALRLEHFTVDTIFNRLKKSGDPLQALSKKKTNADTLLTRLDQNYSFLFS